MTRKSRKTDLFRVNEVELVYRNPIHPKDRIRITDSYSAYTVLHAAWDMNKIDLVEEFRILLLDRGNAVLGLSHIATGSISSCIADPRIIYATALKARASSLILSHNHPSGNLRPSNADLDLTRKLFEGGRLLDIQVLDHLILGSHSYFSFGDESLMPT